LAGSQHGRVESGHSGDPLLGWEGDQAPQRSGGQEYPVPAARLVVDLDPQAELG
jgi:hypothetical protein